MGVNLAAGSGTHNLGNARGVVEGPALAGWPQAIWTLWFGCPLAQLGLGLTTVHGGLLDLPAEQRKREEQGFSWPQCGLLQAISPGMASQLHFLLSERGCYWRSLDCCLESHISWFLSGVGMSTPFHG